MGVNAGNAGNVYIADAANHRVRQVTPEPPATPNPGSGETLPATGSPVTSITTVGITLVALGIVLKARTRRKAPAAAPTPSDGYLPFG